MLRAFFAVLVIFVVLDCTIALGPTLGRGVTELSEDFQERNELVSELVGHPVPSSAGIR